MQILSINLNIRNLNVFDCKATMKNEVKTKSIAIDNYTLLL